MTWKVYVCPKRMHSPGINGEGELRGQPANPGSPEKMAVKTVYVCVCYLLHHKAVLHAIYTEPYNKPGTVCQSVQNTHKCILQDT